MTEETKHAIADCLLLTVLLNKLGGTPKDYLTVEQIAKLDTFGSLRDIIGGLLRERAEAIV
ncbi:hypothetical protein D1872_71090 [compost metagenome]